jgi:2-C-methyl-D-erythritol 4-phosphate cytidylyltransferase
MIEGPRWNIKVTVPEDLLVVEALMRAREEAGTDG